MSSIKQNIPRRLTEVGRSELELYAERLKKRVTREAEKNGFSWEAVESVFKLPAQAKQDLDDQWCTFYAGRGERPYRPNPIEYGEYLEYLRVKQLLQDPRVAMISSIFGMEGA